MDLTITNPTAADVQTAIAAALKVAEPSILDEKACACVHAYLRGRLPSAKAIDVYHHGGRIFVAVDISTNERVTFDKRIENDPANQP